VFSTADRATGDHHCAVIGSPIGHSLSPVLHRAGFDALRLSGWTYEAIDCDDVALPGLVGSLGQDWVGLSVTMPCKAAAATVADRRSARVELLGAANTLLRKGSGWFADNTDIDGVIGALRARGVDRPGSVLVLGGGGTAASAVAAIGEMGADRVVIATRRPAGRAAAAGVASRVGLPVAGCEFTTRALTEEAKAADLVISAVPAGVADPYANVFADVRVLLDVVYHPWPTALAAAGRTGRTTVTGLDMLLHQAVRQFESFTGAPAPVTAMRDALGAAAKPAGGPPQAEKVVGNRGRPAGS
jgi:shikimate dehydrogenase